MAKTTPVRFVPVSRAMIDDASGMVRKLVETLSNANFIFATLSAPTEWDTTDAKWMVRRYCVPSRIASKSNRVCVGWRMVGLGTWISWVCFTTCALHQDDSSDRSSVRRVGSQFDLLHVSSTSAGWAALTVLQRQ
jgi:hypothetical protein